MRKYKSLILPNYSTGENLTIEIRSVLAEINSPFQKILMVETVKFGNCLLIDNIMQASEFDHEIYDKAILKILSKNDNRILILGGGDGFVAEQALKTNPDIKITVAEIDREVVEVCKTHFKQTVFEHPNIKLFINDALKIIKDFDGKNKFNGIVCDLTDNPTCGINNKNKFIKFYSEIFKLSKNILQGNGWISIQGGASKVTKEYINAANILRELLEEQYFKEISIDDVLIPSFGEKISFLYGRMH